MKRPILRLAAVSVGGMTAAEARWRIAAHASLLPCNIRIEGGVEWLHLEVLPQTGVTQKVY